MQGSYDRPEIGLGKLRKEWIGTPAEDVNRAGATDASSIFPILSTVAWASLPVNL